MQKIILLSFLMAAFTSCSIFEPVPNNKINMATGGDTLTRVEKNFYYISQKDPSSRNLIVVGEQVLKYREFRLHTPPSQELDLSILKNNEDPELKGKPLRMLVIGGSLSAGVRDGGYFNEGMLTSYPNLIAQQLKLKKFDQPLFDPSDYNGFGRKVMTDFNPSGGPLPKFNEVNNNTGVFSTNEKETILKITKNSNLDCVCVPFSHRDMIGTNSDLFQDSYKQDSKKFMLRMTPNPFNFYDFYKNMDFDFYILQLGIDDKIGYYLKGGDTNEYRRTMFLPYDISDNPNFGADYPEHIVTRNIFNLTKERKKQPKGFVANIPNVLEFPIFNIVSSNKVIEKYGRGFTSGVIKYITNSSFLSYLSIDQETLVPNSITDSLLSETVPFSLKRGLSLPLRNKDVLESREGGGYRKDDGYSEYEKLYEILKKRYSLGIVDLRTLFSKIIKGGYVTDDGIKVDASYPNGNFFSSDGINPTAFGQAVIANEFIRTINKETGTVIPFIPTGHYLGLK